MNEIQVLRIDKDLSKGTKYVVTSTDNQLPNFVSTSSNGEKPVYIYGDKYGKPTIKSKLKLVSKKGHVSTLFPIDKTYMSYNVFTGDVKGTIDLIVLLATSDFHQCFLAVFPNEKTNRAEVLSKVFKGFLNDRFEALNQK